MKSLKIINSIYKSSGSETMFEIKKIKEIILEVIIKESFLNHEN